MEFKFAYILFICLLMGLSGCRPQVDNSGTNLKTETEERELQRIDTLINHYYATNLDSAEYYCYRKIELLQSRDRLEQVVETYQFLTGLYIYHQSDSLKTQVLNDKLIIVYTNTKQAIKYLRYRQLSATKIANQQKITNFLKLLIGLIVALAALYIVRHWKRMNDANMNLARRTMDIIVNEDVILDCPLGYSNKDGSGDIVGKLNQLILSEKVYLDPNLTLASLAEKLSTDTGYLTQVFNEQNNIGFDDYINDLRVKEACRLLMATTDKNVTIDHILSTSGFSSRTPFYNAFKKFTGVTPDEFKRMNPSQN